MPCEYCGKRTPWPDEIYVPACCRDCGWKPLALAIAWFTFAAVVLALGIWMWRALPAN
jgi:hypothetical protein